MATSSPGDTYATLVGKLLTNNGGTPDSTKLVQDMLSQLLDLQGGPEVANPADAEYDLWLKILTNMCGSEIANDFDTVVDLIRKILADQAGAQIPNPFDTEYSLVQKLVDNDVSLVGRCSGGDSDIVFFSGNPMLSMGGNNLVLMT